jgi:predicted nucleic acid-binding protein
MRLYGLVERLVDSQVIILENELKHLKRTLKIALEHDITVCDALYIAQAENYGEILTSDEKQGEIARKLGIKVIRFNVFLPLVRRKLIYHVPVIIRES